MDYDVEFRDGGPARHHSTRISLPGFLGQMRVDEIYQAWSAGSPQLMGLADWKLLTLDS